MCRQPQNERVFSSNNDFCLWKVRNIVIKRRKNGCRPYIRVVQTWDRVVKLQLISLSLSLSLSLSPSFPHLLCLCLSIILSRARTFFHSLSLSLPPSTYLSLSLSLDCSKIHFSHALLKKGGLMYLFDVIY